MDERKKQLIEELFKVEEPQHEVTNSEIFSLKEWLSYSKERQDSIKAFVTMAATNDVGLEAIEMMDDETKKYMVKMGFRKALME